MNVATLFARLNQYADQSGQDILASQRLLGLQAHAERPDVYYLHVVDTLTDQLAVVKLATNARGEHSRYVESLQYEAAVYDTAVNPMILGGECGNLVAMLAAFECTLPVLARWLTTQAMTTDSAELAELALKAANKVHNAVHGAHKALCLMTAVPPTWPGHRAISLVDLLNALEPGPRGEALAQQLVFQMLFTLHACHARGLMHNDNHTDNWLVGTLQATGAASSLAYCVLDEATAFQVDCERMVFLFDWNHAYLASLGDNPLLTHPTCVTTGECNLLQPARDTFYLLCSLWRLLFREADCADLQGENTSDLRDVALEEQALRQTQPPCGTSFLSRLRCRLRALWCALFPCKSTSVRVQQNVEQSVQPWPAGTLKYIAQQTCGRQDKRLQQLAVVGIPRLPAGLAGGLACRLLPSDADLLALMPTTADLLRSELFQDMRIDVTAIPELAYRGATVWAPGDVHQTIPVHDPGDPLQQYDA